MKKSTFVPLFSILKADNTETLLINAVADSKNRDGYIYEYEVGKDEEGAKTFFNKYFLLPTWLFVLLANILFLVCITALFFGIAMGISSATPKMMNDYCTSSSDCSADYNLICSNNRCSCSSSYYKSGANCLNKLKNGSICASSVQCGYGLNCTIDYSTNFSVCQCSNDRFWSASANYCLLKYSFAQTGCLTSNECTNGTNLVCSNNNCTCLYPKYWNGTFCDTYLTYFNSCTTSQLCDPTKLLQCTVTGSLFYNCLCQPYYYWSTSLATCSAQFSYNSTCYNSTECRSDLGLSCDNTTFNCSCSSADMFWNGSICAQKAGFGSSCITNICDDTLGLVCSGNRCTCPNSYFFTGISCQAYLTYGLDCQNNFQCDASVGLVCDSTYQVCLCNSLYYWNYSNCVNQLSNGFACSVDINCRVDRGLVCTGGACSCVPPKRWRRGVRICR